jgi:uncharacterized protein
MFIYFLLFLLGIAIGILGTLIGAGGGFILVPILLFLYPEDNPETITSISLTVTFANAVSGTIAYIKQKRINFKYGIAFAIASIPGALIGAYLTRFVDIKIFSFIFGLLLICVSVYLFLRNRKKSFIDEKTDLILSKPKFILGIIISFFIGILSSFLGIGGGIIHVPVLSNIFSFPIHLATATSQFILSITCFSGLIVHIFSGKFQHGIGRAIIISSGALIGAQIGAYISSRVKGKIIVKILSIALFLVGFRIIFTVFIK